MHIKIRFWCLFNPPLQQPRRVWLCRSVLLPRVLLFRGCMVQHPPPWRMAAGARHRWLVLKMVDARGCEPVEAGPGIGPDGSAARKPHGQAASQRTRNARTDCAPFHPYPVRQCRLPSTTVPQCRSYRQTMCPTFSPCPSCGMSRRRSRNDANLSGWL